MWPSVIVYWSLAGCDILHCLDFKKTKQPNTQNNYVEKGSKLMLYFCLYWKLNYYFGLWNHLWSFFLPSLYVGLTFSCALTLHIRLKNFCIFISFMWSSPFCTLLLYFFTYSDIPLLSNLCAPRNISSFEVGIYWSSLSLKPLFPCLRNSFHLVLSAFALRKFHSETHSINSLKTHFFPMTIYFVMMHEGCLVPPKHVRTLV